MKKMLFILSYVCIGYLILVIALFMFQRSFLYFPEQGRIDSSYFLNTELEEISFPTSDGLVLKSWIKKPKSEDGYTMLIFHGNGGHVGHRVNKFETFIKKGYGLFFLEYRGYANNPGKPSEQGLYNDALAAIEFLSKQNVKSNKIILYGESLGCGIAVKLSTEAEFAATILESPYTSINDVAQKHYWYLPAKWLVLDKYNIINIIHKIKSPLLILHGENDNIVNIKFGKIVFEAANQPKESLFIPNAGHNNLFEFGAIKKIFSFLEKQKTIKYTK